MTYYIAYGSNMNLPWMEQTCPEAELLGYTTLENYRMTFRGEQDWVYATIEVKMGSQLPVAIWNITEQNELALDDYEDYPNLYFKKDLPFILNGEPKMGMAYIMVSKPFGIPKDDYVEKIKEGYRVNQLPLEVIEDALAYSEMKKRDAHAPIVDEINQFRDERNWRPYHNSKDLALSIVLEASELLEIYQWKDPKLVDQRQLIHIKEEIADVLMYTYMLADNLDLNIDEMIREKLVKNCQKYPVEHPIALDKKDL